MSKILKMVTISVIAVLLAPTIVLAMPVDVINPGLGEVRPDTAGDFGFEEKPNPGIGEGGVSIPIAPDPGIGEGSGVSIPVESPDPGVGHDSGDSIPVASPDSGVAESSG